MSDTPERPKDYAIPDVEYDLASRPAGSHSTPLHYRRPDTFLNAQARGMARDESDMRKNYGRCLR